MLEHMKNVAKKVRHTIVQIYRTEMSMLTQALKKKETNT